MHEAGCCGPEKSRIQGFPHRSLFGLCLFVCSQVVVRMFLLPALSCSQQGLCISLNNWRLLLWEP